MAVDPEKLLSESPAQRLVVRLAGMQRYEGFGFKLVGYVGLLDSYVAQRTPTHFAQPLPPSQK